jgi:hypothetical protein
MSQKSYIYKGAFYTINDIDIVALCHLYPSFGLTMWSKEQRWRRDELFDTIAAPLRADPRYRDNYKELSFSSLSLLIARDSDSKNIVVQLDGKLLEHMKILYTRSII